MLLWAKDCDKSTALKSTLYHSHFINEINVLEVPETELKLRSVTEIEYL